MTSYQVAKSIKPLQLKLFIHLRGISVSYVSH